VSHATGRGLDTLAESPHPLGQPPHVVTGAQVDSSITPGEALDPASDAPEVSQEDASSPEADGNRESERPGAERETSQ